MAYSAATYKGDGFQSTFMIPFDYLQKDFVKVTINEVDKVYAQDYNVDGRELSFPTAPPSGSIIKVYRETPTDRMVKWNEGSVLTSSNMTTQQIQELHLIEETTYNLNISSMMKTEDKHKWEGQYLPITHVGDPTDDSDVVNLGTIKKEETGFLASVRSQLDTWLADLGTTYNNYSKSLKESFDSHTSSLKNQFDTYTASLLSDFNNYKDTLKTNYDNYTSNLSTTFNGYKDTLLSKYNEYLASLTATKDAVKDSEANASKYKDEAKSASDSAKESADQCADSVATCTTRVTEANQAKESASASANTATTKATESGNSATLAKKWAVSTESPDGAVGSKSSKTWAEEAKASEQKATTSANNAKASEDKAKTSEVNAKASETASANSANASAKSATAAKGSEDKAKTSEVNAKASEVAAAESAKQAAAGQINADWNETNVDSKAFVKNKPDVLLKSGGTATGNIIAPSFQTGADASHYFQCQKFRGEGNADSYYHAIDFGFKNHDKVDFYEYGGVWNFHKCTSGKAETSTLVGAITASAGWDGLVKGQDISSSVSTTSLTVTGATSVPTANAGNSSKAIANTEFVAKSISALVNGAPDQLNTLNELAKALGNDSNFAATMMAELAKKLNSTEAESTYATKQEAGVQYQIKRNTAYKVGDVLTSPSLPPGCVIVVTQAGTTGSTEPDWTTMEIGDIITDGTVTWLIQPTSEAPTGVVQAFAGSTTPQGWLLCDGSAVSRTTYASLYACIGTTYGAGDGSTTFNLPNLVDKFIEGSATAGTVKSAGLPNITGKLSKNGSSSGYFEIFEGAFVADNRSFRHGLADTQDNYNLANGGTFDASRSNSIYGNSTTVQPPALTMRYIIKY